jgi:RNA polymerase sigma factor (sigma-70 family)
LNSSNKYNDELVLVLALKAKDQNAFTYLYDNYSGALNHTIFKMINNTELAEDILQETFVKIWSNIENYDVSKGRLFTWMISLTKNLTIDHIRGKAFKKQAALVSDEYLDLSKSETNTVIEKFATNDLKEKLNILKENQKILIDLAYFQGYTQDQLSETLDIPLGTVKSRMRTAIMELRKVLN